MKMQVHKTKTHTGNAMQISSCCQSEVVWKARESKRRATSDDAPRQRKLGAAGP